MHTSPKQRRGKLFSGVAALAIAASLIASCGGNTDETTASSEVVSTDAPTTSSEVVNTDAPTTPAEWDGNGDPSFLETAPAGTPLTAAAKGTVFACIEAVIPTGETLILGKDFGTTLSQADTPWLNETEIDISKIETVPGSVTMESEFNNTETDTTRTITGNGIPSDPIGTFAIPKDSAAYKYYAALPATGYANAAEIPAAPWKMEFTLPKNPEVAENPSCFTQIMFGVALNGATFHAEVAPDSLGNVYDPNAALPTDSCFGHPYAEQYHYHGYSWKCLDQGNPGEPSPLVGYALDGFGIYGPRDADGKLVTNDQLDECHGMVGEVMFNGELQTMYHYRLNNEYPYAVGCFRGTPVRVEGAV